MDDDLRLRLGGDSINDAATAPRPRTESIKRGEVRWLLLR